MYNGLSLLIVYLLLGTIHNGHYYYTDNRKRNRYHWEQRSLSTEVQSMLEVEDEDRVSHRANLAKTKGFTGLSAFYRFINNCVFMRHYHEMAEMILCCLQQVACALWI